MKYLLTPLLFLLSIHTLSVAQTIELTDSEIETLLCQKWDIEYMEMQGMKITPSEGAEEFQMVFVKDGSFELLPENGIDPNPVMKWVYVKEDKSIRLYESDHLMGKITDLNEERFILAFEATEDLPMNGMKGYFKPVSEK